MFKTMIKAAVATAFLATPIFADEAAIKGRQALMSLRGYNAGILFGMMQGKVEYDPAIASAAANNLVALAKFNTMSMWPAGTDNVAMPDKTRAKPEIWSTFPAIGENAEQLVAATEAAAAVAGDGLDALKETVPAIGAACTACHKAYRGPEIN